MTSGEPNAAFVVRVRRTRNGRVIRMQNLRTGEVREFASWAEFMRYAEGEESKATLR